ncbi:hypothetical protein [Deinococcus cavernae]|uniref:hypothetical protein n=1 Tax=Deinococcus cavernae TaxID=2320857 RepID=UPI001314E255|nr:hypothetical protein [Deinococcus cavernae]
MAKVRSDAPPTPALLSVPHGKAAFRWWHGLVLLVALIGFAAYMVIPTEVAAWFGQPVADYHNALYIRAGFAIMPIVITVAVRGSPWHHAVICVLISVNSAAQIARSVYTADVSSLTVSGVTYYIAMFIYLMALAWRPSVHERLEEAKEAGRVKDHRIAELEAQNARYRSGAWREQMTRRREP